MCRTNLQQPESDNNAIRGGGNGQQRVTDATKLFNAVIEGRAELWADEENHGFITFAVNGHREHHPLRGRTVRLWLGGLFYERFGKALSSQPLQDALNALEARAIFGGAARHDVHIRTAVLNGAVYLDLGTPGWEVVEITSSGWRVRPGSDVPVRFRRPDGSRPLPMPSRGGNIARLARFLNTSARGFMFCVAWLLATLRGQGPFPVLFLNGEQGTGKSLASEVLRALTDPNKAPTRTPPRDLEGVKVAAFNSYVAAFDNMSYVPQWLSDALCRLSTGAGFSDRQLYTDLEEVVFQACRPVIVNGIPDFIGSPDLAERTLHVTLHPIPPELRRTKEAFWSEFERECPAILGGLLTALSGALANLPDTNLSELPRMADLARLMHAAEPFLPWAPGAFLSAYTGSQQEAAQSMVGSDPVGALLARAVGDGFEGTSAELLREIEPTAGDWRSDRRFPKGPEGLSHALRRLAPALRSLGWHVEFGGPKRMITIKPPSQGADHDAE